MKQKLVKAEHFFFYCIVLFNLLLMLQTEFVPTLDGPAHLYNSTLIRNLLFHHNPTLEAFFSFTKEPVPNWCGHFFLAIFNAFLSSPMAEKMFLILYAAGLPISFRYLIRSINPVNYGLSYLIFPFIYSFLFFLGFYNFCIALVFFFFTLGFWIRQQATTVTRRQSIALFFLFTLTYFSHIFVFMILLGIIGLQLLLDLLLENLTWKDTKRKTMVLFFPALPALLMTVYYFYNHTASTNYEYVSKRELIEWLKNIRSIIAFNFIDEEPFTKKIYFILLILLVVALYNKVNKSLENMNTTQGWKAKLNALVQATDTWLIAAVGVLFLYFKLPDSDGAAGYVSVRLGLLFFILLICWICTQQFPSWLVILTLIPFLFYSLKLYRYNENAIENLNETALECYKAAEYIEPNSVVLPLNYSSEWMMGHFSNYLGADKPVVVLENYELSTGYFPLKWNDEKIPHSFIGNNEKEMQNCVFWRINNKNKGLPVDYIFMLGDIKEKTDSCNLRIKQTLENRYREIYSSFDCKLYKRK